MFKRRLDANHMRICLRVDQTRKAVAGSATDAFALLRIFFIEKNADW